MTELPSNPNRRLTRRQVLKAGAGAALALAGLNALGCGSHAAQADSAGGWLPNGPEGLNPDDFSFVHLTDTHIKPERGAARGVAKAIRAIHSLPQKPAFALHGGDLVFNVNDKDPERAGMLYGMWPTDATLLDMPVYYCIGNHDLYDDYDLARGATGPDLGKQMWKRRLGYTHTYNTFDCAGWRFIILDSIQPSMEETCIGNLKATIDDAQMKWVADLLQKTPTNMPIVILSHVPMFSHFDDLTGMPIENMVCDNADAFHKMIKPYNIKIVLAGHTHTLEDIQHDGIRYICGGTVCGNLWNPPREGIAANGFGVLSVKNGEISYRYVKYGWTPVVT